MLTSNKCEFQTFEHAPVRTSEDAFRQRPNFSMHQGAKAMIVRVKSKNREEQDKFVMLVFPADLKFKGGEVKKLLGARDVTFATEAEVGKITGGVQVGGVPPFGNLFNLPVYADGSLFENDKIIFNAGDRSFSVAMSAEDYKKIVNPIVQKFAA